MKVKMYEGKEPYIFISYAHKDTDKVMPIVERLDKDGYRVWYDEGIAPIETWDDFIAGKVKKCEIMLAFISNNYINSSNCMDELNYARSKNKKILRVHIEKNVVLPDGAEMRLDRIQAIFRTNYNNENDFFEKLYLAKDISVCLEYHNKENEEHEININLIREVDMEKTKIFSCYQPHIYPNGDVYEGEILNGKRNGIGKMTYANGDIYEGGWKDDLFNGQGKMTYTWCGEEYDGEWRNGLFHGYGKCSYQLGDVYEGEWKNGKRDGYGEMLYVTYGVYGDYEDVYEIYEGEWKEDERNGNGKMTYADGRVYEGEFKDDKETGNGKYIQCNIEIYAGILGEDGLFTGVGKINYPNGDVYKGSLKMNLRDGYGKMMYACGYIYEGEWKYGYRNGKGKMTFADGIFEEGKWENGEFKG